MRLSKSSNTSVYSVDIYFLHETSGQTWHNERPHARLPPSYLGMDAWLTSQLTVALIPSYMGHWYVWLFWNVSYGCFYNQALTDVRSTDAGIECLYCMCMLSITVSYYASSYLQFEKFRLL